MKLYFIKNKYIVNAERYLDKLKYYAEVEFELHINEIDILYKQINDLEEALNHAKQNAEGYSCRAIWKYYKIIKIANDKRELLDSLL